MSYPLWIIINFLLLWSVCSSSSLVSFNNGLESYKWDFPDVYFFDEIYAAGLDFEKFSRSSDILFLTFSSLFDGVCF